MKKLKVLKERSFAETEHPNDLRGLSGDPVLEDSRIEAILVSESDEFHVHPDVLKSFEVKEESIFDNNGEKRRVFRRAKAASGTHLNDCIFLYGLAKVIQSHQPTMKLHLSLVDGIKASVTLASNFLDQSILNSVSEMIFLSKLHVDAELLSIIEKAGHQAAEQSQASSKIVSIGSRLKTGA